MNPRKVKVIFITRFSARALHNSMIGGCVEKLGAHTFDEASQGVDIVPYTKASQCSGSVHLVCACYML